MADAIIYDEWFNSFRNLITSIMFVAAKAAPVTAILLLAHQSNSHYPTVDLRIKPAVQAAGHECFEALANAYAAYVCVKVFFLKAWCTSVTSDTHSVLAHRHHLQRDLRFALPARGQGQPVYARCPFPFGNR